MLSVRSPTIENIPTEQPKATVGAADRPKCAAPTQATAATVAMPPSAPSQVLLGLTRGASFRRPKFRPAKNAPMSAPITINSSHSTACGPLANPCCATCSRASATNDGTSTGRPLNRANSG